MELINLKYLAYQEVFKLLKLKPLKYFHITIDLGFIQFHHEVSV